VKDGEDVDADDPNVNMSILRTFHGDETPASLRDLFMCSFMCGAAEFFMRAFTEEVARVRVAC
jgi:hypothetical protein